MRKRRARKPRESGERRDRSFELYEGFGIASATGIKTSSISGLTSRALVFVMATFKAGQAGGPVALGGSAAASA